MIVKLATIATLNFIINVVSRRMTITSGRSNKILFVGGDGIVEHDSKALFMYNCVTGGFKRGEVAYQRRMFRPALHQYSFRIDCTHFITIVAKHTP